MDPAELDFPGHEPFTAEGWVKAAVTGPGYRHAIDHESQTGNREGYAVYVDAGGNLGFERFVAAAGNSLQGPRVADGQWYYVVGTYDGAMLTFYVNGTVVATAADTRARAPLAAPLFLGAGETIKYFDGVIDEVAIYAKALTAAQIAAHYRASGR